MDIEVGARVEDKNGRFLGSVKNVVRDSWTGEIKKFGCREGNLENTLFYSPEDVDVAASDHVKLKIAFSETNASVQYGARVYDKNRKFIGTVNYLVNDSLTGEIKSFKVETDKDEQGLVFSLEEVAEITPEEIVLKGLPAP